VGEENYQDLIAWQKAMDLVEGVYRATRGWPKEELYGLINQVRRAAVSVPANVAEGQGRRSSQEFLHHVSIAHGSLREVETHLLISRRLGYSDEATCEAVLHQTAEVGRLLNGLMRRLRAPSPARP
jgi:four helix bundle protein